MNAVKRSVGCLF